MVRGSSTRLRFRAPEWRQQHGTESAISSTQGTATLGLGGRLHNKKLQRQTRNTAPKAPPFCSALTQRPNSNNGSLSRVVSHPRGAPLLKYLGSSALARAPHCEKSLALDRFPYGNPTAGTHVPLIRDVTASLRLL